MTNKNLSLSNPSTAEVWGVIPPEVAIDLQRFRELIVSVPPESFLKPVSVIEECIIFEDCFAESLDGSRDREVYRFSEEGRYSLQ